MMVLLQVSDIREILILGFYPAADMASFVQDMNREYKVTSSRLLKKIIEHSFRSSSCQLPYHLS